MGDLIFKMGRALLGESILPPDGFSRDLPILIQPTEDTIRCRLPSKVLGQGRV
jgi:hypothetical protein